MRLLGKYNMIRLFELNINWLSDEKLSILRVCKTLPTYNIRNYASLEKDGVTSSHLAVVTDDKKSVGKVLPWVHIAISNAKRSILDTYHDIKAEFLQLYLNEFCYKFNRRYVGFRLFDRLELCACTYRADFKHRIY